MIEFDPTQIPWGKPWKPSSADDALKMEAELHREICSSHVLFGRSVRTLGHRIDCDDFLFYLGNTPPQFAVVHLSFQQESRPEWPQTELFDSLTAWIEQRLTPDAEEYSA